MLNISVDIYRANSTHTHTWYIWLMGSGLNCDMHEIWLTCRYTEWNPYISWWIPIFLNALEIYFNLRCLETDLSHITPVEVHFNAGRVPQGKHPIPLHFTWQSETYCFEWTEINVNYAGCAAVCGSPIRNVTSVLQDLTSPGYPSNYPANIRCVWILRSAGYHRFDLHFADLDIEASTNCIADYLTIEDISDPFVSTE